MKERKDYIVVSILNDYIVWNTMTRSVHSVWRTKRDASKVASDLNMWTSGKKRVKIKEKGVVV